MGPAQGCARLAADLDGRKAFTGAERKWGNLCPNKQPKRKRSRSLAFRADPVTERPPPSPSSRLLRIGRVQQQQQSQQHGQTQDAAAADSSPQLPLSKRAPGRLLQRSTTNNGLAGRFLDRQQTAEILHSERAEQQQVTSQSNANANGSKQQKTEVPGPGRLLQRSTTNSRLSGRLRDRQQLAEVQDRAEQRQIFSQTNANAHDSKQQKAEPPANPRSKMRLFSQEAGKLSQKDWQVTTDWLAMDMQDGLLDERIWKDLLTHCDLQPSERPQATLYHQLGMTKADFQRILKTRRSDGLLQLRVPTIQNKFRFFKSELNLNQDDIRKLLVKCPRVMEHKIDGTMRPHLEFLQQCGVAKNDLGKVVQRAPEFFQLSIDDTLQPRLGLLKEQLGISEEGLAKIIVKLPNVLTYSTSFMQERVDFLRDSGVPPEAIAKAVVSHPQVLHYLPDSMQEKVSYLRDIGMGREQISHTIQRLPQLLSLDVRHNLKPKWSYLESQMGGNVKTLCTYPAYFSLSLPSRIIPRHRYLQMVRAQPVNPFPVHYLRMTDDKFAAQIARRPLAQYTTFRDQVAASFGIRPRPL